MLILTPILLTILFYLFNPNLFIINSNNKKDYSQDPAAWGGIISILLIIYFSNIINISLIILFIITLYFFYWYDQYNHIYINKEITTILGLVFLMASILAITSTNIIALFLSIEILSLLMIILINLYIKDKYTGIIYYIFSGIFSALFILSLGYLSIGYDIAYKFIYIIFYFKLGLAPFHILLFNIYNNISPLILILIDIPYKLLLFFILYRIHYIIPNGIWIILLGLIIGSIGAMKYTNLINIMIYSSIFNYSLILIALHYNQFTYYFYYLFIYGLTMFIYLYLINIKNIQFPENNHLTYSNIYKILWFIILLNLIGIPPLQGFFIKIFILFSLLMPINNTIPFLLILFFILGIIFFTYTYLRILISIILLNNNNNNNNNNNTKGIYIIPIITVLSTWPLFF